MRSACNRNHPPAQWVSNSRAPSHKAGAFAMRLTVSLLGHTLDLSLEPTATASEDDPLRDLGATGGTFVGFATHATPEDIPLPQRTPAWDEPEERRR